MPRTRVSEPKRQAILEAARRLLAEVNYEGLSINAIAQEAGLSKATFYAYFESKDELRRMLLAEGVDEARLSPRNNRAVILEAALKTFAERGLHATTIEEIADTAGITKGTIYWYFKHKKELFQAVVSHLSPLLRQLPSLAARLDSPPEDMLPFLARTFLSTFDNPEARQLFRILISEAPRISEVASDFAQNPVLVLNFIVAYIEHQVALGRLKPHDVQSSARSFMGAFVTYVLSRELFLPLRANLPEPERYVREVVAIFLSGLRTGKKRA